MKLPPAVVPVLLLGLPLAGAGQAVAPASAPAAASVESVVYGVAPTANGPMELVMDLYRPAEGPVKGAVVLSHGGGFTGGSRTLQENADYGNALASRGYLAAAISYRLAGDEPVLEAEWADAYARTVLAHDDPRLVGAVEQVGEVFATAVAAAAVDQAAAVAWLRERAGELGFVPGDVALFGASAGAITALTLAYAMDLYGAEDVEVAAVVDLRGLILLPAGAPVPFDEGGPPLLILHGEDDQRVPLGDAEEVFRLAREGGTPVELHVAPGVGHELGGAGLLARRLDGERTVLDRLDAFLGAAFAGTPDPVTSLRTRLLPARSEGMHPPDPAPDARPAPGQDREFRVELAAAVRALVDAVEEESPFVASLYGLAKPALLAHELGAPERLDWSYWPRARAGLPLGLMTAEQRVLTHRVLRLLLSAKGYLQVNHVMLLEELLAHEETAGFRRGAEDYHVAVFGEPDPDRPWGLRFEGHHVSLNVTLLPDRVAVTPSFLGAAPAPVPAGVRAGFNPLGHEQRWGFRLLASLDSGQRAAAVLGDEAPADVVSSPFQREPEEWGRWRERLSPDGVAASTFGDGQRRLLRGLLLEVAGTYPDEVSRPWVEALDLDGLAFAWLGATEPAAPHYFRIQGHDFVYELDAAGEGGRHVHSVWRQREGDFGRDVLAEHYRESAHHRPAGGAAPPQVWFVRHAESEFNRVGGPLPEPDDGVSYPLTQTGVRQAANLATSLVDVELHAIYSSTRLRAIQTADAISTRTGVPVVLAPELVEIDFGPEADLREVPALAREWIRGNPGARLGGAGENLLETRERFRPFWERFQSTHANGGGVVMVVAHGGLISVALSELCAELTLEEMLARHIGNAEVVRTRFEGGRLVCYDWDGEPIPSLPGTRRRR